MTDGRRTSIISLWAALLAAFSLLLHAPASATNGVGVLESLIVSNDHHATTDPAGERVDHAPLGDSCRALGTSSAGKFALAPRSEHVPPTAGAQPLPSLAPSGWFRACVMAWPEARGPPLR